ncbi:hypothetical protein PIB30_022789 [Stylosanthes scabra]|uniref:Mitochondrial glycoprotein n=1 Tax=Stylosanthes scabra TaxID=79078 RepID=A0ABU6T908_9FABA|nr:hypothetical protein [Stylosanthes scabra]
MAGFIRTLQRAHIWKWKSPSSSSSSSSSFSSHVGTTLRNSRSASLDSGRRNYAVEAVTKSPKSLFESKILRILEIEMDYLTEYPTPQQPTIFNSFAVEERPGEQVVVMTGRFDDREDIKVQATMFDGCEHVPVEDSSATNVRLHLSLLVDVSKGDSGNELQFICSAWPDCLDVEKVYILRCKQMPPRPYLGPDFRSLNPKVQGKFREYLDARGINHELSAFLHYYMMNKDRIELLRWIGRLKSFVEK